MKNKLSLFGEAFESVWVYWWQLLELARIPPQGVVNVDTIMCTGIHYLTPQASNILNLFLYEQSLKVSCFIESIILSSNTVRRHATLESITINVSLHNQLLVTLMMINGSDYWKPSATWRSFVSLGDGTKMWSNIHTSNPSDPSTSLKIFPWQFLMTIQL